MFQGRKIARVALIGSLLVLIALGISAVAAGYASSQFHYSITPPAGWVPDASPPTGYDVLYRAPTGGSGFGVLPVSDPSAADTSAYVLQFAQGLMQGLAGKGWIQVSAPQGAKIASRPAASFVASYNSTNITGKFVVFSSSFYRVTYALDMESPSANFTAQQSTWDSTANSFVVTGEPAAGLDPALAAGIGVAIVAVVLVVVFAFLRARRRRAAVPPPMPAYGAGPPGAPPGAAWQQPPPVAPSAPSYPGTAPSAIPTQTTAPVPHRFCAKCGAPLATGSTFCGSCGTKAE
jgi:uncharacterized protein (TIGR03382 family)